MEFRRDSLSISKTFSGTVVAFHKMNEYVLTFLATETHDQEVRHISSKYLVHLC